MRLAHVTGLPRRAAEALLASHYTATSGNAGYMFAAIEEDGSVSAACLIGVGCSEGAKRALVAAPYDVWTVKRLFALDSSSVVESQMLRFSMRAVAELRGQTLMFCSYADPAAVDERDGRPLLGHVYLAAGFFYAGLTSQPRYGVVDAEGRARSTRQGKTTLSRKTLPDGWRMVKLPPARVWLAVVPPLHVDGRPASRRWRRRQWRRVWAALHPVRRVAAQQWIDDVSWRRRRRGGQRPLDYPRQRRGCQRLQPSYWRGGELQRTAGPVWVPHEWQGSLLHAGDVQDEHTAGRTYLPRLLAAAD